jgi:hypothetical protein
MEGTGNTVSGGRASGSRLVATRATAGHASRSAPASWRQAPRRCSQLSRISSARRSPNPLVRAERASCPGRSRIWTAVATALGTSSGSSSPARSAKWMPSGKRSPALAAISSDRRVLPAPPGPWRVTSRPPATILPSRRSSSPRPTKVVVGRGRSRGATPSRMLTQETLRGSPEGDKPSDPQPSGADRRSDSAGLCPAHQPR